MTDAARKPKIALWLWVCLASTISLACTRQEASQDSATRPASQSDSALPMPFGRHTDDLEGMLQRQNIRALVMINPIGFFYDSGQPMGVMYEALSALQTYVNEKFKTGALKVQVSFIPVRPDQVEAALTQGVGDFVAYSLVVTPTEATAGRVYGSSGD